MTATRSPGLILKLIFSVWLKWLPVAGRASVGAELQMQALPNKTGFYTIDALMTGDPAVLGDVLAFEQSHPHVAGLVMSLVILRTAQRAAVDAHALQIGDRF